MYQITRNNYHQKPKNSNIYTSQEVSQFIFNLLKDKVKKGTILDPCSGQGSLLKPWKEADYSTWGIDVDPNSNADAKTDFFTCKPYESEWNDEVSLVLCNPPFNRQKTKSVKIKRDYSKCFQCGSNDLGFGTKKSFCLECRKPASDKCVLTDKFGIPNGYCKGKDKYCRNCHHQGQKDYFSICRQCYEKVPIKDDLTRPFKKMDPNKPFGPEITISGKYHQVVDWNWIIEKQKELESKNNPVSRLGSEVWLDKIIELFGKDIPIVLFVPVGFLLNQTLTSQRKTKFENGTYPPISSIISLPKNIFPGVIFHSEILIFNIKGLKGHYFYKPYE